MYPVRLDGQRIYLREISVTDAVALQRVVGDPTVCETLIFEPKTLEETREYLASWEERAQAQPRAHYYLGAPHLHRAVSGLREARGDLGRPFRFTRPVHLTPRLG